MHIFENPYIVIAIFALGVVLLATIGIVFAIKGLKAVKGVENNYFVSVGKTENFFNKLVKERADKAVLYISLSADNPRGLYSNPNFLFEIKQILLKYFSDLENGRISIYDEKNFISLLNSDTETVLNKVEFCQAELNSCFLKFGALNIVSVRFGIYFATGATVTFDEAISRAKQACMLAKNQKKPYAEWNLNSGKAFEKKIV